MAIQYYKAGPIFIAGEVWAMSPELPSPKHSNSKQDPENSTTENPLPVEWAAHIRVSIGSELQMFNIVPGKSWKVASGIADDQFCLLIIREFEPFADPGGQIHPPNKPHRLIVSYATTPGSQDSCLPPSEWTIGTIWLEDPHVTWENVGAGPDC